MASSARKPIVANPDKIVPPGLPTVPPPVPPTIRKPNRITSDGHGMREMAVSSTCLDSPLRFVTGPRLVVGKCLIEPLTSGAFTYVAFEFGYGPHDSLGTVEINEEAVSGLDWVSSYEVHLGTTSQAASTLMQEYDGSWNKQYPGIAYVVFKVTTASADHPGTWKVTTVPTGWKVTDFRDASTVIGNNPIVFAYQAYTHRRFKGLASAIIHDASWERVADMCDDVMGDSSKRYVLNAVVESGDSDVAIQEALDHCHAWLVEHGGELRMAAYMLPRPGDGTWAVTAGTTLAGTGGDATNDFAVGDRVLIKDSSNWYIRTITAIGGADSITVDGAAITVSAAKVMATSGVHIERDHWAQLPAMASTPPRSIPERMPVQFIQGTTGQPDLVYAGSQPTSDAFRQSPVMLRGCPSASQGTRWGETSIARDALQRWSWQGIAGPMCPGAARLEPGDVYEFSDDDLTRQLAIVLSATHLADKHYLIACQKFDPDGPSSSTESDETPPTVGGGWDSTDDPPSTDYAVDEYTKYGRIDGRVHAWDEYTWTQPSNPERYDVEVRKSNDSWSSYDVVARVPSERALIVVGEPEPSRGMVSYGERPASSYAVKMVLVNRVTNRETEMTDDTTGSTTDGSYNPGWTNHLRFFDTSRYGGDNEWVTGLPPLLEPDVFFRGAAWVEETIRSGKIALESGCTTVDTEGGAASDNLDYIFPLFGELARTEFGAYDADDTLSATFDDVRGWLIGWLPVMETDGGTETSQSMVNRSPGDSSHYLVRGSTGGSDTNDPTWVAGGLSCDGTDDYCLSGDTGLIDPDNAGVSVAVMIKPDLTGQADDMAIVAQQDGTGAGCTWLGIDTSGYLYTDLGSGARQTSNLQVTDDTWCVVVLTVTAAGAANIWMDCTAASGNPYTCGALDAADGKMVVGADKATTSDYYKGVIGAVLLWDWDTATAAHTQLYLTRLASNEEGVGLTWPSAGDPGWIVDQYQGNEIVMLRAASDARPVTARDGAAGGNIQLSLGDCTLTTRKLLALFWDVDAGKWREMWRSEGPADQIFAARRASDQTVLQITDGNVEWTTEDAEDAAYTHSVASSTDEITIEHDGDYVVQVDMSVLCTNVIGSAIAVYLQQYTGSWANIAGSRASVELPQDEEHSLSITWPLLAWTGGDKIRVHVEITLNANITILANTARVMIWKLNR